MLSQWILLILILKKKPCETWETWTFNSESFDSDGFWNVVHISSDRSLPFSQF